MLRYKTETRPGLVALYDIRPGNGAGQFLQPQSPHRASKQKIFVLYITRLSNSPNACLTR